MLSGHLFKDRIRNTRHEKGLTAQMMADNFDIKIRMYINYDSWDRDLPIEILVKIADILDVSLDYLMCRDEFIEKQKAD